MVCIEKVWMKFVTGVKLISICFALLGVFVGTIALINYFTQSSSWSIFSALLVSGLFLLIFTWFTPKIFHDYTEYFNAKEKEKVERNEREKKEHITD